MVVGVLRLELALHEAGSLKEKRSIVKRVLARCRNRFPVSCAETGLLDYRQSSQLGFAVVTASEAQAHSLFERVEEEVELADMVDVVDRYAEFLHY